MSVEKIHVEGQAATPGGAALARKVAFPPLPINGTWAINGQVFAVDPAGGGITRQAVYNIAASGICIAGVATETDGVGPSGWPTQPSSNALTAAVVTAELNNGGAPAAQPTVELALTGTSAFGGGGIALDWFWELDITLCTVP